MLANKQVQMGNHTWDHANLLPLSSGAIAKEITRNEEWIQTTFGVTGRPYFRPPYGYYNKLVEQVAGDLGYTQILMWNGTFGDATPETPTQILALAEQWLKPGTIMLGHLNHPTILGLFDQIEAIIAERNLEPVTLDEMFGTSRHWVSGLHVRCSPAGEKAQSTRDWYTATWSSVLISSARTGRTGS